MASPAAGSQDGLLAAEEAGPDDVEAVTGHSLHFVVNLGDEGADGVNDHSRPSG